MSEKYFFKSVCDDECCSEPNYLKSKIQKDLINKYNISVNPVFNHSIFGKIEWGQNGIYSKLKFKFS
jgi:hypothetical protein